LTLTVPLFNQVNKPVTAKGPRQPNEMLGRGGEERGGEGRGWCNLWWITHSRELTRYL